MTDLERETYDVARSFLDRRTEMLFVPRMAVYSPGSVESRLSNPYIRTDATVILVDGSEVAQIPYELFKEIHPGLFVEMLRYAHSRHLLNKPGRLIELVEHLLLDPELP